MKYYDSLPMKLAYGAVFFALSLLASSFVFHRDELTFDLYLFSYLLVVLWALSLLYFMKSLFVPRLKIFRTEIIIFGFRRKAIPIENIKELSLNADFVFISFKDNGELRSISFSILKTKKLSNLYIYNGKFQSN